MKKSYRKISQKLRVTFTDQIGSIGGTLGLFCGFSFLAIIEMLYWTSVGLFKLLQNGRTGKYVTRGQKVL